MTKKHFEAIAKILKRNMPQVDTEWEVQVKSYHKAIIELANYFGEVNPNFDNARFVNAVYTK